MSIQDAPQQSAAVVFDVAGYATARAELVQRLEAMDAPAYEVLSAFRSAHPELVPCGELTWQGQPFWTVSDADDHGITFSHDCTDHGYDLFCTESVTVPTGWILNPRAWDAAQQAATERKAASDEAARLATRRSRYEALRTEFEPKSR